MTASWSDPEMRDRLAELVAGLVAHHSRFATAAAA